MEVKLKLECESDGGEIEWRDLGCKQRRKAWVLGGGENRVYDLEVRK